MRRYHSVWIVFLLVLLLGAGGCSEDNGKVDGDGADADRPDMDIGEGRADDGQADQSDGDGGDAEPGGSSNQEADDDGDMDGRLESDGEEGEGGWADRDEEEGAPVICVDDADCPENRICFESSCIDAGGVRHDITLPGSRLIYRNDTGRVDIYDTAGDWIVRGATAFVMLDATDETGRRFSVASAGERTVDVTEETDRLGVAMRLIVTTGRGEDEPGLVWRISGYPAEGFYSFRIEVVNDTDESLPLAKTATFSLDGASGGGLYLGDQPSTHRILENGSYGYMDHMADIRTGDTPRDDIFALAIPGDFAGHSASNWNHCVKDLESPAVWIAGSLSFESSLPIFNLSYDAAWSQSSPDGRAGFSYFSAEAAYLPYPKPVESGRTFASELTYIHPAESCPFEGLERYATAIKRYQDIVLWHERSPDNRIPNGWNSWTGSGGTGGYGTDIDEELILANLDVMADEFRDWGIDWFQIDDGYEPAYGDWVWKEDRFPHGPRWLSDRIREKGLRPGLWIAPLTLAPDSKTVADHPDWVAEKTPLGSILAADYTLLDFTNPEVQDWLRELFRKFRNDWNFDWLKMDFAYWALVSEGYMDATKTREEMYRDAVRIIREEIGDETFFLAVAIMGLHYGLVDADRVTLDSAPIWDWEPDMSAESRMTQQGLKPTVRTAARRYYLHNRIWINHPDLIIFRSNPLNESWPRVTLNEAQAFCTYVGFSGGIVKMGDRLVDMTAEQINSVRKLLPIYPKGGRPLDLFTRDFPELWHLRVDGGTDGFDEPYDLVAAINWGRNWDLSTNPYTEIPDSDRARRFEIDLATLGLPAETRYLAYEFWTGTFLGEVEETLLVEVPAHTAIVVALRPMLGRPQFLGWNRQITMGATDIKSIEWDEESKILTLATKVAKPTARAPFTYRLDFHLPDGCRFLAANYSGSPVTDNAENVENGVLQVTFIPDETGEIVLSLEFESF